MREEELQFIVKEELIADGRVEATNFSFTKPFFTEPQSAEALEEFFRFVIIQINQRTGIYIDINDAMQFKTPDDIVKFLIQNEWRKNSEVFQSKLAEEKENTESSGCGCVIFAIVVIAIICYFVF